MATTYLSRTQVTGSTDTDKKFTISLWIKRGSLGVTQVMCSSGSSVSAGLDMYFDTNNNFTFEALDGSDNPKIITDREFRDPGAWMHIVVAIDTPQATDTDRVKIYVNGIQETEFSTETYPAQDYQFSIGTTSDTMKVGTGTMAGATNYWNGDMAHLHYTDGQVYAPTAFGSTDATSGIWVPISGPSVTYGNNGMFLKFSSGATLTDSSGNGNNMTLSGGTLTPTKDNAMNNFATLNSLDNYRAGVTFSNGNTTVVTPASSLYAPSLSTMSMTSGKWYWEVKPTTMVTYNEQLVGIASSDQISNTAQLGYYPNDWGYYANNGNSYNNNVSTSYGDAYVVNDIIGVALDLTNNKLYFAKNNTWQNSGVPTSGATGTGALSITAPASTPLNIYRAAATYWHSSSNTYNVNFGNGYFGTTAVTSAEADGNGEGSFEYAPPTGYFALCTNNLGSES